MAPIMAEFEFGVFVSVGWMGWGWRGGEPENPEEIPRSKAKIINKPFGTRPESNAGHIGGRREL